MISPFTLTVPSMSVCIALRMLTTFGGMPFFDRTFHRALRLTVAKALVRLMNTAYRFMRLGIHFSCNCLAAKIMPAVLRPVRIPRCDSEPAVSRRNVDILICRILERILLCFLCS